MIFILAVFVGGALSVPISAILDSLWTHDSQRLFK